MELAALIGLTILTAALFWIARSKRHSFAGVLQRAMRPDPGACGLRAVSRLHLSPHHSLHVVDTGQELLLIGCSPQGIAAIGEIKKVAV